jgi:hypothetical protein
MTLILHVGSDAASRATSVDLRIVAAGLAALSAVFAALFFCEGVRALRRFVRPAVRVRAACAVVLVFVVMPNVLPYDHLWLRHGGHESSASEVHASHCHGSPSSCTDPPLTSGPGQMLYSDMLLPDTPLSERAVVPFEPIAAGQTVPPDFPPPRA